MYSKFFEFQFLSAKLSSIDKLFHYNLLSGISIVLVNIPMMISASLTCYYDDIFQQMFIEALEVIVISLIMIIFQITNIKKPEDFFKLGSEDLNNKFMV